MAHTAQGNLGQSALGVKVYSIGLFMDCLFADIVMCKN